MFPVLLLKFKAWLRQWLMVDSPPMIGGNTNKPSTISDGAAQLVERARQGDQNAMALIAQVGQNAKKKMPRAIKAFKALERYIKDNPVKRSVFSGAENKAELDSIAEALQGTLIAGEEEYSETVLSQVPDLAAKSVNTAIVTLANGPSLLPSDEENKLQEVRDSLSESEEKAFMLGYKHGMHELEKIPGPLQCPFLLGHILGTARRIQAVRMPDVPVSVFSPQVGAEFGE